MDFGWEGGNSKKFDFTSTHTQTLYVIAKEKKQVIKCVYKFLHFR